jgi:hypothetical protein
MIRIAITVSVLACAVYMMGCSSAAHLISDWKNTEITIDGKQNDWEGSLYDFKKENLTIGIRNDADNLYLCFISYDQGIKHQIMNRGFTIWFDPGGGTNEIYGIKFPIGHQKRDKSIDMYNDNRQFKMSEDASDNILNGEFGVSENMPPPPLPGNIDSMSSYGFAKIDSRMPVILGNARFEMQFLGPNENDVQQTTTLELKSAAIQINMTQKTFIYELKLPLYRTIDFPFTLIPTNKKKLLGIEFKTEGSSEGGFGRSSGGPGGRGPGGGRPPSGGGIGESGPGGEGEPEGKSVGRGFNSSDQIEIWIKAVLAGNPDNDIKTK